ncbi:MAG TPA: N,N-dimethylformamidase beta subunit family domain-containing protein [Gaiellaceae bacterium]
MRRSALLVLLGVVAVSGAAARSESGPRLVALWVSNGDTPFAGDRRLLTTVSPNGDGFRDRAIVSFTLDRPAKVTMEAVRTDTIRIGRPAEQTVWSASATLQVGPHRVSWRPARTTPPRTYILRLTTRDAHGVRHYGDYRPSQHERVDAPVVRIQGIDAGFTRRSYAPGQQAELSLATDAKALRLQVFYFRFQRPGELDPKTSGIAMTSQLPLSWSRRRSAPRLVRFVRAGDWPSGLYFLRAAARDGRTSYAPFIVRPSRFGSQSRVAVVLSTNTWQAYNFRDANGDGWGDSWYVSSAIRSVDLNRPYLDFGVPFRFRDWDLTFISWLNKTGKQVEYLSDDDLERFHTGDELARAYNLVVFPGHAEYVTAHAYDVVQRYRDLGGNLMFLAANNFFWSVRRDGHRLVKGKQWRARGRPEAGLVGVQYAGSNHGATQAGFVVTGAATAPWAFAGTGLRDGDAFGRYGIEIDARTPDSPPGTELLARIPNVFPKAGLSAEMTYYETPAGAKVFAAGALNFAASVDQPVVSQLLENLWSRLSLP